MSVMWYSERVENVLEKLQTDPLGLKDEEVKRRLEKYGLNELKERKRASALSILL
ncbi:hypothetical protein KAX01_03070, partial [Candidatus Bathyarchaeota archaeon]|nr:hypothetical protein [Candidatus Bathyarchaeota archaeon]